MKAGFLTILAPGVLLASTSIAVAQQPRPAAAQPPRLAAAQQAPTPPPQPPPAAPMPQTAAPLPPTPAALSVPDPFAGLRQGPRDLYRSPDGSDRFQHLSRYPAHPGYPAQLPVYPGAYYPFGYGFGYGTPYYETSMAETYRMAMAESYLKRQRQSARDIARGGLALETIPGNAQVFVDGYYMGLAEELDARGGVVDLDAGAHRIELRAPGYETLAFSVRIEPNEIVRYRGRMDAVSTRPATAAAPTPPPPPAAAKSFYVIPGCYAGDKPPTTALPKGCDLKKLQTRK